jgi:asparagine synthase (glutamine-hydrolysing)
MCGLSGSVAWDGHSIAREHLERSITCIKHRGPDAIHIAQPTAGVGLAHARLRVIDLTTRAAQPMANAERTVWLVFNGEIYNFRALRHELEADGHQFHSASDTEVILRAYEAWGSAAIARLDGMFALAIWDSHRQTLLLARDRIGKKPLYYYTDQQRVVFGSEIKALVAYPDVPCAVREDVLPFILAMGYPPAGSTAYVGIRQVPVASYLAFRRDTLDPPPVRYWSPTFTPQSRVSVAGAAGSVRRQLSDAVERRLVADVPLGAFLSGGVDSTIVVGLMTQLQPQQRVKTFSIGFEGDARFDETAYAEQVAEMYHTEHTQFTVTPQSFDLIEQLVQHHDQPFGDSSALPTYLLSQLTRQHVTVALSGDGGDELFGGYARFVAALWAMRIPPWILRGCHGLLRHVPVRHERSLLARLKRGTAVAELAMPERFLRWIAYCGDSAQWMRVSPVVSPFQDPRITQWWNASHDWTKLSRLLYLNFMEYLPHDLMVKTDRCSMAHGLEVRSPFLDTALVEYVNALPDHLKIRGWQTKRILRKACCDLLPSSVRRRPKMGFGVPLGAWFRRQWRTPTEDLLLGSGARLHRYVQPAMIASAVQEHMTQQADHGHKLWLLLTIELWLRNMERMREPTGLSMPSVTQT